MNQPPQLFDRALRARRRDRAARAGGFAAADYLHKAAADGFVERLEPVTRGFPSALILGAASGAYAEAVRGRFGIEAIDAIESAPALAEASGARLGAMDPPDLPSERYDLILFGLELHAANDPVGALIAARRALKPDGLLLACLFGGETLHELRAAMMEAEIATRGGASPRVAPMGELRELGALMQRAGYAMPVADCDRFEIWHADFLALLREIRAMGESNALAARERSVAPRALFAEAGALYHQRFARADGKVKATVELVYLTGWAPGPNQPQAKRPGSATTRLADALGVEEKPAGEKAGRS